ncbi:MAG: response regulator transcription factor [Clostridia bacterium]|nr:response regulator transcription factor [Clostridia bacterium]MBQ9849046.1 response regulator transcription factor [Clostridia bacterium]
MAKILVAEDEKPIRNLIMRNLELTGHTCVGACDGLEATRLLENEAFDLLILDVMMPKLSGFEVFEYAEGTPVVFVTAKNRLDDRLKGLSLGADDYIVKPFEIQELLLRVKAVLRRTCREEQKLAFDDIVIDFSAKKVFLRGNEIILTPKEYSLFETLVSNRNVALSRDKLISLVWGYDYEGDSRTVDVHIRQIRAKLELKDRLKTLYKTGYRFEL